MSKLFMLADLKNFKSTEAKPIRFVDIDRTTSAQLMVDSYFNTIDWEDGDGVESALAGLESAELGEMGEFISEASLAILDDEGSPISEVIVALYKEIPTILFLYTHPREARRGLARSLIQASAEALRELGYSQIGLFVTVGNPAQALYTSLGFGVVQP